MLIIHALESMENNGQEVEGEKIMETFEARRKRKKKESEMVDYTVA